MSLFLRLFILLLLPGLVGADIYNWQNQDGTTSFSDTPTHQSAQPVEPSPTNTFSEIPTTLQPAIKQPKVSLYTTSWCGFCRKARAFFKQAGIAFSDYDIEKNSRARQYKQKMDKHYQTSGVPMAIINNKVIYGFRPEEYKKALEMNN